VGLREKLFKRVVSSFYQKGTGLKFGGLEPRDSVRVRPGKGKITKARWKVKPPPRH